MTETIISHGTNVTADGTTLELINNVMGVKDSGISTAKIADAAITAAKMGFGTMVLVAETTLTADATQVDFTGLDLEGDGGTYLITFNSKSNGTTQVNLAIAFNSDNTTTNYKRFDLIAGVQYDDNYFSNYQYNTGAASNCIFYIQHIQGSQTTLVSYAVPYRAATNVIDAKINFIVWKNTSNVTSISFISATNRISAGTTIRIYKLTGA